MTIENESAINQVVYDGEKNKPMYNLGGRKVSFKEKGIVIQNGKKIYSKHNK